MPGRRGGAAREQRAAKEREEEETVSPSSTKSAEPLVSDEEDDGPRPPKKPASGWGEEAKRGKRASKVATKINPGKRSSASSRHWDDDGDGDDDEIPMIPTLDDEPEDEELAKISAVANAPKMVRRTVQSKAELDHDIRHVVPTAVVDGRTQIDLSILKASLSPKDAVHEPDVPWAFDSLLQEVSQAMERDAEPAQEGDDDLF